MANTTRVPTAARNAVRAAAAAYVDGTDDAYRDALSHLQVVTGDLDDRTRVAVNDLLAATAADLRSRAWVSKVVGALHHGEVTSVAVLPGDLEVLQVHAPGFEQLLVTVPAHRPTESARRRRRVHAARQAVLQAGCNACGARLRVSAGEQLDLPHDPRCALHPEALARAR